jgi:hypothetical protein
MGSHLERSQSDGDKREQLGYIVDVNTVWGAAGLRPGVNGYFFSCKERYRVTWLGESNPVPKFEPTYARGDSDGIANTHVMTPSTSVDKDKGGILHRVDSTQP